MHTCILLYFVFFLLFVCCTGLQIGMFKKNDYLVAQDTIYKERIPYRTTIAKYGRVFKCPITYVRVVDRLGVARGPQVKIIRGGLQKKVVVLRLVSPYNQPISVNIYVGCENKAKPTTISTTSTTSTNSTTVKSLSQDAGTKAETTKANAEEGTPQTTGAV